MSSDPAARAATLEGLRERIRKLQAAPRRYLARLRTGVAPFDALLPGGGLPLGHAVELWGEAASGRTSLALRAVAAAHREGRLAAWVDGPGELYPPAAAALGVDLARLLIARPPARAQGAWAALQLARSGAFACVVLDLTHTGVRLSLAEGKKLADAAVRGGCLLVLLTPPDAPGDGMTRLRTQALGAEGLEVEVVRSRQGGASARTRVPWAALYPVLGDAGGLPALPALPPKALAPARVPQVAGAQPDAFSREQVRGREGHCGIQGQRPGRDAPMPSLRAGLGVPAPSH